MNFSREKRKVEALTRDGVDKFASDDFASAWETFERVLFIDEDNPTANTLGAASLVNLGRLDDAEPLARRGVQLTPQLALAHYYLALLLIAKEKYDEAESEIWEAIAIEPGNGETRLVLGRFLFILGRHEEAREQLTHCVGLSADSAEAHFLLGLSLMSLGQISDAKEELEKTLRLQPDNDIVLTGDALLSITEADDLLTTPPKLAGYRHAVDVLRRAVEVNPSNELASEWLRIAEETVERISRPTEPTPPPERWYKTAAKHLLIFVGLAAASIATMGLMIWLQESGTADFWAVALCILIFDLVAFCLMSYLRRDFSALPPSIVRIVERVRGRDISPIDTSQKS